MELTLGIFLAIAIIYILWQEKQPKTDKERKLHEGIRERRAAAREIQDEKNRKKQQNPK
jgi:uncharacterized membrane protein